VGRREKGEGRGEWGEGRREAGLFHFYKLVSYICLV